MPFTLLDHTADAKFRATGETLEEAFACAVEALTAIATNDRVPSTRTHRIEVAAQDLEGLLFGMIERVIFLIDTERFLAAHAQGMRITHQEGEYLLVADLLGDDVRAHGSNLKAPTYSEMAVTREDTGWTVQAVVDI